MVKLNRIPVLFFFFNPAPLLLLRRDEEENEDQPPVQHRDNTPWCVCIPALGVTVQAVGNDGNPIVGYWDHNDACDWGVALWNQLINDTKLLEKLRKSPEAPLEVSKDPKIMQRTIFVQAPQNL